ncbi:unnamed protein product [Clonostachys rosea]|uniref:C2H2-type domain-containing protein n=1 Tax=Bionectria ochroleuca TaxID=29856 RepID=A0ABY6UYX5_BIOOC|nr:unnamed protein product [Clonostachys rosea]
MVTPDQGDAQQAMDLQGTDDYSQLARRIKETNPQVVRQVLRDNWQPCFLGSEFHTAFILNTMLHQSSPGVLSRAIQDFGGKMVKASLPQILGHCTTEDYDRVADILISKVSLEFLDKALARRLETIEARSLVNALARAERLGYDVSDIVEDRNNGKPEHVIPSLQGVILPANVPTPQRPWMTNSWPGGAPPPAHAHVPQPDPRLSSPNAATNSSSIVHCEKCQRPCSGPAALSFHRAKDVCRKIFAMDDVNRTICAHCGRHFTSGGGLYYHKKGEVCGVYSDSDMDKIMAHLQAYLAHNQAQMPQAANNQWQQHTPAPASQSLTTPMKAVAHTPASASVKYTITQLPDSSPGSLLSHLNPTTRKKYEEEIADSERRYGAWMQEALDLPEPERTDRLTRLKNSYNTRQSTTRKKYGIRLRGNRTPEEIESERRRLFGAKYHPDIWSMGTTTAMAAMNAVKTPQQTRTPEVPSSQADTPRKRVRLSEMGGLSGSAASVETTDPTAFLTSSQPNGLSTVREAHANGTTSGATPDDPMAIDSDGDADIAEPSTEKPEEDGDSDNSSSETDGTPSQNE